MLRSMTVAAGLTMGLSSYAATPNIANIVKHMHHAAPMVSFNVGDTDNYNLTVSGMTGTMVMKVTAANMPTSVTIETDMNIAGQSQTEVEVIDPTTGDVISVTVNGQSQTPPAASDVQITSTALATITVPAGTYKTQDVKIHLVSENEDMEQWADMDDVPVGGMVQMTTTEDGMAIEAQLTSIVKGS